MNTTRWTLTTTVKLVYALALAVVLGVMVGGCTVQGSEGGANTNRANTNGASTNSEGGMGVGVKDAAGMTQAQVEKLSLEQQYELARQRYEKMQVFLQDAQRHISTGPWVWNGGDILPSSGITGGAWKKLPGVNNDNSYYFTASRLITPPGATGAQSDLEPMRKYFDSQGWRTWLQEVRGNSYLWADTGEGYLVEYGVQTTGQYYVSARSEVFWGDVNQLSRAISSRDEGNFPEKSLPGEYQAFPKWTDPIVDP